MIQGSISKESVRERLPMHGTFAQPPLQEASSSGEGEIEPMISGEEITYRTTSSNVSSGSDGVSTATPDRSVWSSQGIETSTDLELQRRQRRATANALFDPETLELLQQFARRVSVSLDDVSAMAKTPIGWTKVGLLMQAYFVEVVGLHMRITEEGNKALSDLREYVNKVNSELRQAPQ